MAQGVLVDRVHHAAGLGVDHHGGVGRIVAPSPAVMGPPTRLGGRGGEGRQNRRRGEHGRQCG